METQQLFSITIANIETANIIFKTLVSSARQLDQSVLMIIDDLLKLDVEINFTIDGRTLIQHCIVYENTEVVEMLIKYNKIGKCSDQRDEMKCAASRGNHQVVKMLLEIFVEPNYVFNDAFQEATRNGHYEVVKLLLEGKKVTLTDQNLYDALEWSFRNEYVKIVRLLQKYGANLNWLSESAILFAFIRDDSGIVEIILESDRFNPNVSPYNEAIEYASLHGKINTVKLLLKDGRIKLTNNALIYAKKYIEIVKILLDNGVNPCTDNNYIIKWASSEGNYELVKLLLEHEKIDPCIENNTLLRHAIHYGHLDIVKLLLSDTRVLTHFDKESAIEIAKERKRYDILKFLNTIV